MRGHGGLGARGCVWEGRVHSLPLPLGPSPCMWPASPRSPEALGAATNSPAQKLPAAGRVAGEGRPAVLAKVWSAPPKQGRGTPRPGAGKPHSCSHRPARQATRWGRPLGGADRAHLSGEKWQPCPQRTPRCQRPWGQWPPARHCGGTLTPVSSWKPRDQGPGRSSIPPH